MTSHSGAIGLSVVPLPIIAASWCAPPRSIARKQAGADLTEPVHLLRAERNRRTRGRRFGNKPFG